MVRRTASLDIPDAAPGADVEVRWIAARGAPPCAHRSRGRIGPARGSGERRAAVRAEGGASGVGVDDERSGVGVGEGAAGE